MWASPVTIRASSETIRAISATMRARSATTSARGVTIWSRASPESSRRAPRYNPAMRRLGRWMLNALTMLSLLLCVSTCVLWARSFYVWDIVDLTSCHRYCVRSMRGGLIVERLTVELFSWGDPQGTVAYAANWEFSHISLKSDAPERPFAFGASDSFEVSQGLSGGIFPPRTRTRTQTVSCPHWFVAAILALPSGLRLAFRRRRPKASACPACSYDLTGNVSGVCPECGTKIATPPPVERSTADA